MALVWRDYSARPRQDRESGLALKNILTLLRVPVAPALTANGLSIGLSSEDEYGILIQVLAQSTKSNLLSTPSITTLDNQEARILVGQNVPFRTGSFTLDQAENPFDTIERQDIGVILRVVPQVSQGDSVQLAVSQEVSSISNQNVPDAADIITNKRQGVGKDPAPRASELPRPSFCDTWATRHWSGRASGA